MIVLALWRAVKAFTVLLGCLAFVSFLIPFALALVTFLRQWKKQERLARTTPPPPPRPTTTTKDRSKSTTDSNDQGTVASKANNSFLSSILVGRVWHKRHLPRRHGFDYPLFMFGLDLSHDVEKNQLFDDHLWPLSCIMRLRPDKDHLKNGEGFIQRVNGNGDDTTATTTLLSQRICNLVSERTQGQFQPTVQSHCIYLVTHLCYYGYCFNPVSFYYVVDRQQHQEPSSQTRSPMEITRSNAIVAEVSNTPWNEMHPYVLHPNSMDEVQVNRKTGANNNSSSTNYIFPKRFHVSPFMEMNYNYDWIIDDWSPKKTRIVISMKKMATNTTGQHKTGATQGSDNGTNGSSQKPETLQFTASMTVHARGLDPFVLAWHMARYPIYCFVIQVWIHYEALLLFLKGIAYQPHPSPRGGGSAAGRFLGGLIKSLLQGLTKTSSATTNQRKDLGSNDRKDNPVDNTSTSTVAAAATTRTPPTTKDKES
ncbi:hypothetical protein ACA910_016378 [Epithemia clementina (nom. ined.)]